MNPAKPEVHNVQLVAELAGPGLGTLRREAVAGGARAQGGTMAHALGEPDGGTLLEHAIASAREALLQRQQPAGHWVFELEADCTIPAEYIMMMHFLDEIDVALEQRMARYLRARQAEHGGWPLYEGGAFNLSCSVKSYFALKLTGDAPDAPHMLRAREAILAHGGAAHVNVFTRIALALFGEVPWRAVPYIPVEIMLLPKWFPFHIDKVAYWSRTVMVPLFILCTRKPMARNPRGVHIRELFTTPPEHERHYFARPGARVRLLTRAFFLLDRLARLIDPLIPTAMRERATRQAESWMLERLNGEDGLGAIFPAMVNALEVMTILGYPASDPRRATAKRALEKLVVETRDGAYCQPCVSPVWDTSLASLALQEEGGAQAHASARAALDWLVPRQLLSQRGDWAVRRPDVAGGGWPFQFGNDHYPDLDDTAVVAWSMHQADPVRYANSIARAIEWLVGLQSENGGFASFDADNTYYYLNEIPFADHGALLDPPTSDVTARVVTLLARVGRPQDRGALDRALLYLRNEQEADGSWFGRWGTNYIYGTWSVLVAFEAAGVAPQDPAVVRAVAWLKSRQNPDGGWGESNDSYADRHAGALASTPYQTAWALLGLMSAGEVGSGAVRAGIEYLIATREPGGLWSSPTFTAPGFPRVFYLRYHGYSAYFPLWALTAYRRRTRGRAH